MSGSHDGKMRSLAATAGIGRCIRTSFCVSPLKQPGGARAAFADTSRAFVFEPTAADEVSISSDAIVFRGFETWRAGARTRSAKASRRLRSCKKSMRPGVSTDSPERLRRSLKRSCHGPAIGLPEKGRNSAGPSAQMRAAAASLDPIGKFKGVRDLH